MTPQQKRRIEKILKVLSETQSELREMLREGVDDQNRLPTTEFDAASMLTRLKQADRTTAENLLTDLRQWELGDVFIEAGGPAADRKKPKVWLIEQILWRVYDFERGHEAIRKRE